MCWLSLVAASGGYSLLRCAGFSLSWLLLLQNMGSRHVGFSNCGTQALEHRLSSCGARGLVASRHVGSSQARGRTRVSCIGRWILNHCATREAPSALSSIALLGSWRGQRTSFLHSLIDEIPNFYTQDPLLVQKGVTGG